MKIAIRTTPRKGRGRSAKANKILARKTLRRLGITKLTKVQRARQRKIVRRAKQDTRAFLRVLQKRKRDIQRMPMSPERRKALRDIRSFIKKVRSKGSPFFRRV